MGIDVSIYQRQVDWAQVAASGRAFAFAKATEGTDYVAPNFGANWQGIKAVGMVRGAYHFAHPNDNTPDAEADYFLRHVGPLEPGDMLVLDLETGDGNLRSWTTRWLSYVESRVGFQPILYSNGPFLAEHGLTGDAALGTYPIWLAAFQENVPPVPDGWASLALWQHSSSASVAGVNGPCDESYCYVPLASLGKP